MTALFTTSLYHVGKQIFPIPIGKEIVIFFFPTEGIMPTILLTRKKFNYLFEEFTLKIYINLPTV